MRRASSPAGSARTGRAPALRSTAKQKRVKDHPHAPEPVESAAGEEDPGASLGDPATREAMREESRAVDDESAARQREQSESALDNVREGYRPGRRR